jgi:hypothetical protein
MEQYDRGTDSESPKRIKTGAIEEKGDVKTNIPILDLDPFMDTDPSMTGFKKVQIEAFKGNYGPLDEYSRGLSTYSPTEPSFPAAMLAADAMKLRLEATVSANSATSSDASSSSLATSAPAKTVVPEGDSSIPAETSVPAGTTTSDDVSASSLATSAPAKTVSSEGDSNIPAKTNVSVSTTTSEDVSSTPDDISSTPNDTSNTPDDASNTPDDASNTLDDAPNTPDDASNTPDDSSDTPDDISNTPTEMTPAVSTTTSDNTSIVLAETDVYADSSVDEGTSEHVSRPPVEARAQTNTVTPGFASSYPVETSLPSNTVEPDGLSSLPDYESDSPQSDPKLTGEGFKWPQLNPNEITHDYVVNGGRSSRRSQSIMTESSGSEADESLQLSSLESSLDYGLENPRYSPAITGGPQFFNNPNFHRVQEWVGTAQVDANWNPTALEMAPGQQWEQQRSQRRLDIDGDEMKMMQQKHHEEEMERRQGCIQRGEGYTYYPFDPSGTLWAHDIIHETVNHGMTVLTSEFIPPGSNQASNQVAITGGGHQEFEAGDATEDDQSNFNDFEEAIKIGRRRPRYYPERRSGAEAIMDARRNRSSFESQLAIDALTRSVSQHSGRASFNETAGPSSAYAGQSGIGASRDDPIDLTDSPPSRKRKNRSEDSEPPLPTISSLIAQTTPRHTHEIKRARLEKVAARANFPVFIEPHPDVDWIRRAPPGYVTLNHGHIKENIDESMTTDQQVQRWFQTNEGRRDRMLFLRHGPAPEEEDWERRDVRDVPGRDAEREAQIERARYYNVGRGGYMPR